ncbi:hypothetical protein L596_013496 [Steinernema carpocapsae]|uniref:Neurotransmitter-gated ion-channel transmembrane domain-containing protein n=1 Tax=Steinernema carpocapsae TaxID=34508 RepID=A0A4U5P0E4_STECR|nr:hypothetical protein L596_013496 [Steinernema carpocapsae]
MIGILFKLNFNVGVDYLERLWKPDTFFPNEKKSFFHVATTHNSFLRIDPDGTVFTSQSYIFSLWTLKSELEIESYGYSVLDIIYFFNKSEDSISRSEFELPQFVLIDVQISSKIEKLSSGAYSRVFLFKRNIGFYIIQIYLPSILIVVISWVSFWLSRDATPARVALGVLTVLTMTTLMTTTNAAMPKVSYVKSIDIFLGVSFLMVFSSLLEYAAVGYISKRIQLMERRKISKSSRQPSLALPCGPPGSSQLLQPYYNSLYQPFYSSEDKNSNLYRPRTKSLILGRVNNDECSCPIAPQNGPPLPPRLSASAVMMSTTTSHHEFPSCSQYSMDRCLPSVTNVRPSDIDKYSRVVFPLIFVMFNFVYWCYFYSISGAELSNSDF